MQRFLLITLFLLLISAVPAASQPQVRASGLVVRKSEFRLDVMKGDSAVRSYPLALGKTSGDKRKRGDNRTPEGKFRIVQIQRAKTWVHDFGDGKGPIPGAYGPWFLRLGSGETHMAWSGIGIHGTHDTASIGTLATEGCIRLKNEDLEELKKMIDVGTPVTILP